MKEEILNTIREKGLLLDKETYELVGSFVKAKDAMHFLDNIEKLTGQKLITKSVLKNNVEFVKKIVSDLPGEEKKEVENIFVKFGIHLEIRREKEIVDVGEMEEKALEEKNEKSDEEERDDFKVFHAETVPYKKLEVKDFVGNFRARYQSLQRILIGHPELANRLVSVGKISSDRQSLSIIGIVTEKRITKNKNLIIKFEDMTGEISGVVKFDNEELFSKAEGLMLDDIVGVKASGNRDLLFVHDIIFPDSVKLEKTKFEEDVNIGFLSDVHCGSDKHLGEKFEKFLDWINSDAEDAKKVKYLFFVGDNVDGVGIFPGQENRLDLKSMEEQYSLLESYLRRVPKRIMMFMCPGQHDATRVAEPQPPISKKYAPGLYEIENLILVTNPSMLKFYEGEKEFKILMYHGASLHSFINEIKELREMKAHSCPAKAVKHLLKRRHLAPSHGGVVYIPNMEKDPLVIEEVPDVLCTGEVHRLDIENYNGTLIITGSCWQSQTDFEEKVGNIPDPSKVPLLNLKTRELKVLDFSEGEEEAQKVERGYGEKE
tara:strand:- start:879 stop:2510 length:1632 start_codon:yes stop_codon:yes gene_type:complete